MDPRLSDLTKPDQTIIAIIYLVHLIEGHTHHGFKVCYETLKGYVDAMSGYAHEFVGRDIRLEAKPNVPEY